MELKTNINKMDRFRDNFISEFQRLLHSANNGHIDSQILLASKLLTETNEKYRVIEAYKWVFISLFLGNAQSNDMLFFIRISMSEEQILEADDLVEKWIEVKNQELLESRNQNWSKELLETFKNVKKALLN